MSQLGGVEAAADQVEGLLAGLGESGTRIVLIDGPAGSGKTTIATEVARRLGAGLVHMDSLYRGWDGLEAGSRMAAEVVAKAAAGEASTVRAWDWQAGAEGDEFTVDPSEVLLVEGVGAASAAARAHAGLVVWVEADAELRYKRAIERDGEVFAAHWDEWAAQEAEHFTREGTRAAASTVLHTDAI
jgi:uridine kinase